MKKITRPRRTAREAILDAAAVVYLENPGASFGLIAKQAGVGRATLYRHFPTREDLIQELTLEAIRATDQATKEVAESATTATEYLRLMIDVVIPVGDRFRFLGQEWNVKSDPKVEAEIERQSRQMRELIEACQQEGLFAPEVPVAWIAKTADYLIWAAWETIHEGDIASGEAGALVFRTLVEGLGGEGSLIRNTH